MRKRLWGGLFAVLLAALCLAPTGAWADDAEGVQINETNFPDATFRSYISGSDFDKDENGYLSDAEIAAATEIYCYNRHITTLKGIEYFTALKELDCSGNDLTSLDVSRTPPWRSLTAATTSSRPSM